MYRIQLEYMKNWLQKGENRKPLVIRGARQVGKSTLVKLFAAEMGLKLNEVNLEKYKFLNDVFKTLSLNTIVTELDAIPKLPGMGKGTLLFLDEIQSTPFALPSLRYFYEELNEQPVVAAGSLLEFLLKDHDFSMPVGRVQYLHLGPMTFSEFLIALDEEKLAKKIYNFNIEKVNNSMSEIGSLAHERLLELVRIYFFVGGMPEAVSVYSKTRKLKNAMEVHRSILDTYRDDFPKYIGSRNLTRMLNVFDKIPPQIGRKIKYSNFSADEAGSLIKRDLEILRLARIANRVSHSSCNGLPLQAEADESISKLLFLDIGLVNCILGLAWGNMPKVSDDRLVNEGPLAEQFIGQHLVDHIRNKTGNELNYWLREGKQTNAEIDFVIALNGTIIPIEVKAGKAGSLKSLHQFMFEKKLKTAIRFDCNTPLKQKISTKIQTKQGQMQVEYELVSLPLYLVESIFNA